MAPCASPRLRARQHHVGLVAPGFAAAVASAGDARSAQSGTVSVVRTNKGDRLPLAFKRTSTTSSPAVSTLPRPPIGCEPAFSRNADPARAHIFALHLMN